MKNTTLAILLLALTSTPGFSQTPPVLDHDARVKSVESLKLHIEQREARFQSLKEELLALDGRWEKQVDSIVKTLATLKDSNDSKTRVANAKGEVMKALVRTIWVYRQKRTEVFERMRKDPTVPADRLEVDLKAFDAKIDKRVEQVMELSRSFPGHEDFKKYESDGGSYYNGWYEEDTRVNEDWKQNRRDVKSSAVVRRELLEAIGKALNENESRRATIVDALANRKMTAAERSLQQKELGRADAMIDNLQNQRRELALPAGGAAREIGSEEAHDGEQMLEDARADLSRDFSEILRKYGELDKERTRLVQLKANLKAREEWLEENPK